MQKNICGRQFKYLYMTVRILFLSMPFNKSYIFLVFEIWSILNRFHFYIFALIFKLNHRIFLCWGFNQYHLKSFGTRLARTIYDDSWGEIIFNVVTFAWLVRADVFYELPYSFKNTWNPSVKIIMLALVLYKK